MTGLWSLMFESPTGDASPFAAQMARELLAQRTGVEAATGGTLATHGNYLVTRNDVPFASHAGVGA